MTAFSTRRRTMITLLSATTLTVFTAPAWADCGTLSGSTYTTTNAQTDCSLNSGQSLVVTGTGQITADESTAAVLAALGTNAGTITNNGLISGTDNGVNGIQIDGSASDTITNNGTIEGNRGIYITRGDTGDGYGGSLVTAIINNANGTISSTGGGAIDIANPGTMVGSITNSGVIQGPSGIRILNGASVTGGIVNNADATISDGNSFGYGIFADDATTITGGITNSGTISGQQGAIYLTHMGLTGNLTNTADGVIDGGEGYGIAMLNGTTLTGNLSNAGSITSNSSSAIHVTGSTITGALTNTATGTIHGYGEGIEISQGSTVDSISNSGEITSDNNDGIYISTSTITGGITNAASGTITGSDGDGIDIDSSTIGGNIMNAGIMTGAYDGLYLNAATVNGDIVNSGTISGTTDSENDTAYGLYSDYDTTINGKIMNTGTIAGNTTGAGMFFYDGSTLTGGIDNGGTISGGVGIQIVDGGEGNVPTTISGGILNRAGGTISGGDSGIVITGGTVNGGITNAGTITGAGNNEIDDSYNGSGILVGGATVTGGIANSGTVTGSFVGLYVADSALTGDIVNSGTITGGGGALIVVGNAGYNGTIINSGTLTAGDALFLGGNGMVTVNNTGLLDGDVGLNDDDGDTLNLNGATGRITGETNGSGNSTVNVNGTFTAENLFDVGTLNVASGGRLNTGSQSFTTANGFNNAGTVALGNADAPTVTGDYTQAAGGTLRIGVDSAAQHGVLAVSGVATFAPGTNLFVDVTQGNTLAIGQLVPDVVTAGTLNATTFTVADNSLLFNFEAVIDGNTVDLNAVRGLSVVESTDNQGNSAGRDAARTLDQILTDNPGGNFDKEVAAFSTLTTEQQVSDAVTQTLPVITGGTTQAAMNTMTTTSRIVQAREDGELGLSSGDGFLTNGAAWLKPFGSWANEDNHSGTPGFDADTYGVIGGADKLVTDTLRLGLALSYANSNVTGSGAANGQKVNVNNYQLIGYGSKTVAPRTDVNFQFGGGFSKNDEHRDIAFGGLDERARGDYTSYNFQLGTGIGRTLDVAQGTTFTPSVRADYQYIRNDSYNERGAGALNLQVDSQSADELIPSIDGKLQHSFSRNVTATVNAGIGYDVLADRDTVTSSFAGGGAAFSTNGTDPSSWVSHAGLGVTVNEFHGMELTARYDGDMRGTSYDNQTVSLKLRAPF